MLCWPTCLHSMNTLRSIPRGMLLLMSAHRNLQWSNSSSLSCHPQNVQFGEPLTQGSVLRSVKSLQMMLPWSLRKQSIFLTHLTRVYCLSLDLRLDAFGFYLQGHEYDRTFFSPSLPLKVIGLYSFARHSQLRLQQLILLLTQSSLRVCSSFPLHQLFILRT